jgi:hypothetical protein
MPALSAPELLGAWERGLDKPLLQRALLLLRAAYPQEPEEWLAALSIGQRDAELFALREQLFGVEMACVEVCPQCGQRLDLTLNAAEIRASCATALESEAALRVGAYELEFRCPNSEDLAAALTESTDRNDVDDVRSRLIERCLLSAKLSGTHIAPTQLPDEIVAAVSEQMARADPLADIQLAVACASCGHHWRAAFDIVSFLWREIESLAARLLRDVHKLASAYGWQEKEILALTPVRRQFYLALLGA